MVVATKPSLSGSSRGRSRCRGRRRCRRKVWDFRRARKGEGWGVGVKLLALVRNVISALWIGFFPQAMLARFSFRAGVPKALEVRKIGRSTQNQTIRLKTCWIRLQKRARSGCKNLPGSIFDNLKNSLEIDRTLDLYKQIVFSWVWTLCGHCVAVPWPFKV